MLDPMAAASIASVAFLMGVVLGMMTAAVARAKEPSIVFAPPDIVVKIIRAGQQYGEDEDASEPVYDPPSLPKWRVDGEVWH